MFVTLDTSQLLRLPLNFVADLKVSDRSLTVDTSQSSGSHPFDVYRLFSHIVNLSTSILMFVITVIFILLAFSRLERKKMWHVWLSPNPNPNLDGHSMTVLIEGT